MKIPEARNRLAAIADQLGAHTDPAVAAAARELAVIQTGMFRRKFKRGRAPTTSTPMTASIASQIRAHVAANPDASNQEVAELFGVNSGRVTDALAGRY